MNKWIAEFDLEDGDKMPEHMDLEYKGAKLDFHCRPMWIPVSEKLPDYGVAVLTYDGICYCVEKRIPTIRDDNGEPISGEWWVSDDYDGSNSEYYPNLRDGACIAWMPLPKPYKAESEDIENA